jgi:hypothetical protein
VTTDDEFERTVLAGLAGEVELSERYPGQGVFWVDEVAKYLGWPMLDDTIYRAHPDTGESAYLAAYRISQERETFYLYGAILKSREERLADWASLEESSGHKRYDHSDFGYASWNCEWCWATFIGDRPGETPDPKTIRCEKNRYRNRQAVFDMKNFRPEEWT